MKHKNLWKPTKFLVKHSKLVPKYKNGSYMIAFLIGKFYTYSLKKYCKNKIVLDLGCGHVPFYEYYKNIVKENICVDWSNSLHQNPHLDYIVNISEEKLPLKNNSVDVVVMSDVLEHIYNPFFLFKEIKRVLKKEGTLIFNVPFFYWIHEYPHDYNRYTEYFLKKILKENNFSILEFNKTGGVIEVIVDIFSKIISSVPLVGNICSYIFQKIHLLFINIFPFSLIKQKTSKWYTLEYAVICKKVK